jgi:hypothetical protein
LKAEGGDTLPYEDDLLLLLRELVPENVRIIVLQDRGFGDVALHQLLIDHGLV